MVYLIFSDLHSNLESLEKFIEISETIPHDQKACWEISLDTIPIPTNV